MGTVCGVSLKIMWNDSFRSKSMDIGKQLDFVYLFKSFDRLTYSFSTKKKPKSLLKNEKYQKYKVKRQTVKRFN